jgi:hypothetical protein
MVKSKLSKAEQLAVDLAKWTAKRDAAIGTLIKATERLRQLERSQRRLAKVAALEEAERKAKVEQRKAELRAKRQVNELRAKRQVKEAAVAI